MLLLLLLLSSYEIQLCTEVRRKGLGKFLIQILQLIAFRSGISWDVFIQSVVILLNYVRDEIQYAMYYCLQNWYAQGHVCTIVYRTGMSKDMYVQLLTWLVCWRTCMYYCLQDWYVEGHVCTIVYRTGMFKVMHVQLLTWLVCWYVLLFTELVCSRSCMYYCLQDWYASMYYCLHDWYTGMLVCTIVYRTGMLKVMATVFRHNKEAQDFFVNKLK